MLSLDPDPNARSYGFKVDSDNRFRIEDVVPGRYQLIADLWDPCGELWLIPDHVFATFEVPPMAQAYSDEPLDLGEVMLTISSPAGEPVETSGQPSMSPDGSWTRTACPRPGAQVVAAERHVGLLLRNAILEEEWANEGYKVQFVETDAEGRFHFEGEWSHPFYLFAAHASGFAPVTGKDFQKNREIRLQRWGRIEGQLAKGRRGTDGRVWMVGLPSPAWVGHQCDLRYDTPCDADGRFVFERVPAGWFNVGYLMAIGDDFEGFTARTAVVVKAGETARVKVGGEGRPVIGRFVAPASYGRACLFRRGSSGLAPQRGNRTRLGEGTQLVEQSSARRSVCRRDAQRSSHRGLPSSSKATSGSGGGRSPWRMISPLAGDAIWSDVDWRGYAFRIEPDGSFRIEDVVPGQYELTVDLVRAARVNGSDAVCPISRHHRSAADGGAAHGPAVQRRHSHAERVRRRGPAPLFEDETSTAARSA